MPVMKVVVWFNEVDKGDVSLVGGKGANLGELTKAKIPVPPGFIVTSDAFFQFLHDARLRPKIQKLLANLDPNQSALLQDVSAKIKKLIVDAPAPEAVAREVRRAYRELEGGPVAVRSSSTAEDLAEASFAGQQSTFLNVVGEDNVVEAVQACWASLFEARAIFYREQAGFDHLKVGIAVPVQRMVQSNRSGVMFTIEPVTGDPDKVVIEAIFGLGEAVVSGALTPDLYVVDEKTLRILDKNVAVQDTQMTRNPEAKTFQESNVWVDVPADLGRRQKLTNDEIVALAEIGRRIEEHYGVPQDIEWAEESGEFYIVQARPVTVTHAVEVGVGVPTETAPVLLEGQPGSPGIASGPAKVALEAEEALGKIQEGDVLVTSMTAPDWVPAMKRATAIVTERGGRTCHAAIVSRELGIPLVMGIENATKELNGGQIVTVDGVQGRIYAGRAEKRLEWWAREQQHRSIAAHIKTKTKVLVNLAEPDLAETVAKRNVDGVGLLRAEFIIADHIKEHPRLCIEEGRAEEFIEKLAEGLRKFAKAFYPRPVVYRATDFKTNEYHNLKGGEKYEHSEENPMIGYRGASRYVQEPEVFKLEIEAIKRVRKEYPNLWLMIPFVRTPEELAGVKAVLEQEGLPRSQDFKLWMMAEVPSNVFLLDQFIDVGIDGISIGSNDLTQLILGIDRDNARFAHEFDERNEAVVEALERLVHGAIGRGITCSICGQAPSDYPELTRKLVEWHITSVSVNPDVIDKTREIIAKLEHDLEEAARAASPSTAGSAAAS
ncbi:MAG: phosphoenolpyruvate synthase [Chloroflexi bacterium]|nr:phosphoenolpyruvate synthase [Chloroflexota bacterium]